MRRDAKLFTYTDKEINDFLKSVGIDTWLNNKNDLTM
jgi:tRNA(His) 5'-end guanylyltransferase